MRFDFKDFLFTARARPFAGSRCTSSPKVGPQLKKQRLYICDAKLYLSRHA